MLANRDEIQKALAAPFDADDIEWRIQQTNDANTKATVLAYITARGVISRLNDVLGVGNWAKGMPIYTEVKTANGKTESGFLCELKIKIGDEWISQWDGAPVTDIEPIKGGISDSIKRAAVNFGVGVYLYDLPNSKVALVKGWNNSSGWHNVNLKDKDGKKEWYSWKEPILPSWALPAGGKKQTTKPEAKDFEQAANTGVELAKEQLLNIKSEIKPIYERVRENDTKLAADLAVKHIGTGKRVSDCDNLSQLKQLLADLKIADLHIKIKNRYVDLSKMDSKYNDFYRAGSVKKYAGIESGKIDECVDLEVLQNLYDHLSETLPGVSK
jgi:hypothetical protein